MNKIPVFSMNLSHRPVGSESFESVEKFIIPQHHDIFVRHETLEGVDSMITGQDLDLFTHSITPPCYCHVETVVTTY